MPAQSKVRHVAVCHCCRTVPLLLPHYCRWPLLPSAAVAAVAASAGACSGKPLVAKNAPTRVAAFSALRRARSIFGSSAHSGLEAKWQHMSWALYFIQAIGE